MQIKLHNNDIPNDIKFGEIIAIDTETMGLNPFRDRLCLVHISNGRGTCHLVKINEKENKPKNLIKILKNKKVLKIFHFARFDVGILKYTYNINIQNIYCTKIASKLTRTFTDKHGYKDLCEELLNVKITKTQQTSDWGAEKLTTQQQKYAATDVLYLHKIREKLNKMLKREDRVKIAEACFKFIEYRTQMDLLGWSDLDIFRH